MCFLQEDFKSLVEDMDELTKNDGDSESLAEERAARRHAEDTLRKVAMEMEALKKHHGSQLQAMMQMMGGMGGMGGMPQGGPQGGPQPGQIQINLTPEQRTDVDSLVNMGLGSQSECLQIYLACDKDVNQAASILMDQAQ